MARDAGRPWPRSRARRQNARASVQVVNQSHGHHASVDEPAAPGIQMPMRGHGQARRTRFRLRVSQPRILRQLSALPTRPPHASHARSMQGNRLASASLGEYSNSHDGHGREVAIPAAFMPITHPSARLLPGERTDVATTSICPDPAWPECLLSPIHRPLAAPLARALIARAPSYSSSSTSVIRGSAAPCPERPTFPDALESRLQLEAGSSSGNGRTLLADIAPTVPGYLLRVESHADVPPATSGDQISTS
ncbi:hypothetical protein OH76DRAFT_840294 [Lentinus brumalis]|uniref:Uncharacterized protein n=1 Tax=Lentinus brumalis TaxID=2498619 RepID=A0A371D1R3_9APHY|nr:hypothetical protein OH76DRAFT_840294 [Polyporus brumalis]